MSIQPGELHPVAQQIYDWLEFPSANQSVPNSRIRSKFHCHARFVRQAKARLRTDLEMKRVETYFAPKPIPSEWGRDKRFREDTRREMTVRRAA